MESSQLEGLLQRWIGLPWVPPSNGLVLVNLHVAAGCCSEADPVVVTPENLPDLRLPWVEASGGLTQKVYRDAPTLMDRYLLREFQLRDYEMLERALEESSNGAWHGRSKDKSFLFGNLQSAIVFHLLGLMNLGIPVWSRSDCNEFFPKLAVDGALLAWHPSLLLPTSAGFTLRNIVMSGGSALAVPHVAQRATFGLIPELENMSEIVAVGRNDFWSSWFGTREIRRVNVGDRGRCHNTSRHQLLSRFFLSQIFLALEALRRRISFTFGGRGITSFLVRLLGPLRPFSLPAILPSGLRAFLLRKGVMRGGVL